MTAGERPFATRVPSGGRPLWPAKRPPLTWLDAELTERCGNRCVHCSIGRPADDEAARRAELTAEEWGGLFEQAAGLGCLTVRLTGGEPLLRPDFEAIYLAVRRLGIKVKLFTNATLVTARLAELFARVPPKEPIEVSLYGMSRDAYEAVTRIPGSRAAAGAGISLLLEKGIPFVVKGAVLPPNRGELPGLEAFAAGIPGMERPPSLAFIFDLHSRRDPEASARIRKLRWPAGEAAGLLARGGERYLKDRLAFLRRHAGPRGDALFTCASNLGKGAIDPYGRFQHCLLLRHPETVFDLRRGGLGEALREFLPRLRGRLARNPAYLERCGRCFLKDLCGQCPARSWSEHGDLDTPVDYLCDIAHAEARRLGVLDEGENAWTVDDWRDRIRNRQGD